MLLSRVPHWAFLPILFALMGCAGLDLQLVNASHARPSNVAMFFTVDTRSGEPVPGLQAEDFRIYEDGQLVSVDESQQTIVNPEVAAEHFTLLLVDMSGSVTASDQVPAIVTAAESFIAKLEGSQKVAVYAFDGSEEIFPMQRFRDSSAGLGRLSSFQTRDPSTNLYGAMVQAADVLDEALGASETPLRFGTLVVFTDGTDRAARVGEGDMSRRIGDGGYDVFAIGVGTEIDERTLGRVGRSGYVLIDDAQALTAAFETIGQQILGFTRRFYLLSYCSPARAGVHEVTVEALARETSGSVTYRFDAEGFGPNCDPGRPPAFETSGRGTPIVGPARGRIRVDIQTN
ncbi:MAG: VWA domain-containing protein [Myxococcota bacterium]